MEKIDKFGTVWMALTYNCNNRCRWCYAASNISKYRNRELDPTKENDIIRLLKDLNALDIKLVGGEPTVYRNFIKFIKKLSDYNFRITLVTNGRKFADFNFAKRVRDAGLSHISFSIEGYNEDSHDRETCVNGSFRELMQGIENSRKLGFSIVSNTTITKGNANDLEKIVDLVFDKVKIISFNICEPWLRENINMYSVLSPKEGAELFKRVYRYGKLKNLDLKLTTPTPVCNFDEEMIKEGAVGGICSILAGQNFVVDYNGDILPCTLFSDFPFFNIFKNGRCMTAEEFLKEYNEGSGHKLREKLKHFPSSKCNNGCEEFCTGGCPLFWLRYDPEKEIKGVLK